MTIIVRQPINTDNLKRWIGVFMIRILWKQLLLAAVMVSISALSVAMATEYYGEIGDIKGNVRILRAGEQNWYPAHNGLPVTPNDFIKTDTGSSCSIKLDDGSLFYVSETAGISVLELEFSEKKYESKFSLLFGRIIANIEKTQKTKLSVHTPTAVVAVRGTDFAVDTTEGNTDIGVFEGAVEVAGIKPESGYSVLLDQEQETSVKLNTPPEKPRRLSALMEKTKKRNSELKARTGRFRESLRRAPPEQRTVSRKRAVKRFSDLKKKTEQRTLKLQEKRFDLKEKIKSQRRREIMPSTD